MRQSEAEFRGIEGVIRKEHKLEITHEHRLVTYGTLAPGQVNHAQLAELQGRWLRGTIRGKLVEDGWGATHGCPGIHLDPAGEEVEAHIFESLDLPQHWARLDEFEGEGYARTMVQVETEEGAMACSIYELAK